MSQPQHAETDDAVLFGVGAYHNMLRGIELTQLGPDFRGLVTTRDLPAGTVVWKNRPDGPAEASYRKLHRSDLASLTDDEVRFFVRYSYQNGEDLWITPLNQAEVEMDASNCFNHSCSSNVWPLDEDHWATMRDVKAGESLTIDYATFDSNNFICIDRCLCGATDCRKYVRGDDWRILELQQRYQGHFLPYIAEKIARFPELARTTAQARAAHDATPFDIVAHNQASLHKLICVGEPVQANEVGIPRALCTRIYTNELVTDATLARLHEAVRNGPSLWPGARAIISADGTRYDLGQDTSSLPVPNLAVGMKVERHLIDGDEVIFNRRPALDRPALEKRIVLVGGAE
jgi:hypothetical protein